jgi:hypothetical protein
MELTQPKKEMIQESAVSYLDTSGNTLAEHENILPEPPMENSELSMQTTISAQNNYDSSTESS